MFIFLELLLASCDHIIVNKYDEFVILQRYLYGVLTAAGAGM